MEANGHSHAPAAFTAGVTASVSLDRLYSRSDDSVYVAHDNTNPSPVS
jgi:hypothetical protein